MRVCIRYLVNVMAKSSVLSFRPGNDGETALWLYIFFFLCPTQAIIATLVQLFFAWRVRVLTSNRLIVVAIVVCAIIQLCTLAAVCR